MKTFRHIPATVLSSLLVFVLGLNAQAPPPHHAARPASHHRAAGRPHPGHSRRPRPEPRTIRHQRDHARRPAALRPERCPPVYARLSHQAHHHRRGLRPAARRHAHLDHICRRRTAMWTRRARCTATSSCSAWAIPRSARAIIPMSSPALPRRPRRRLAQHRANPTRAARRAPPWPCSICSPAGGAIRRARGRRQRGRRRHLLSRRALGPGVGLGRFAVELRRAGLRAHLQRKCR